MRIWRRIAVYVATPPAACCTVAFAVAQPESSTEGVERTQTAQEAQQERIRTEREILDACRDMGPGEEQIACFQQACERILAIGGGSFGCRMEVTKARNALASELAAERRREASRELIEGNRRRMSCRTSAIDNGFQEGPELDAFVQECATFPGSE